MSVLSKVQVKVADEVWVATALLHRENPKRNWFSVEEIVDRAAREGLVKPQRPGVYVHAVQHCVANRPPNPGRYRMLLGLPMVNVVSTAAETRTTRRGKAQRSFRLAMNYLSAITTFLIGTKGGRRRRGARLRRMTRC